MELKAVFRYGPPADDAAAGDGEGAGTRPAGGARGVAAAGALAAGAGAGAASADSPNRLRKLAGVSGFQCPSFSMASNVEQKSGAGYN